MTAVKLRKRNIYDEITSERNYKCTRLTSAPHVPPQMYFPFLLYCKQ